MIFRNNQHKQHKREIKNVLNKSNKLKKDNMPSFSYGLEELGLSGSDKKRTMEIFVQNWFKNPEQYLDLNKFSPNMSENRVYKIKDKDEVCYKFNSFLDQEDTAKFYESEQPFYGGKEKTAFIILPHWNAYFKKYKYGTSIIHNFFLPVATYRYFPAYATEKDYGGKSRYDIVGPNIGLTIKRFWQDILNIQHFGKYLKNELGYDKIGIWSYSIGSPRGYLACMFSENLFDYLIMNFLADNFSESLLHGIATKDIAKELLNNLDEKELDFLFSPLSPGRYIKYLNKLPKYTRLVQGKYDLVFGEENNKKMIENIKKYAPFVDIEFGDFGHTTSGEIDKVLGVVYRNSRFVLKNKKSSGS